MNNTEAKEQAIINAFGEKWQLFTPDYQNHLLTRKHWVDRSIKIGATVNDQLRCPGPKDLGFEDCDCEVSCEFWRPIALKGIENNNGWIRVEPDSSNLPQTPVKCKIGKMFEDGQFQILSHDFLLSAESMEKRPPFITHFKPIEKDFNPVY